MISIQEIAQTAGFNLRVDNRTTGWFDSRWYERLQPGSWRGVGFMMDAAETRAGRRIALHEYPYRDTVWAEDLGRLPRRFSFQAFLVGDDCYDRRDAMIAAVEQPGEGTLVHPTLGTMQVVCVDFSTTDRRERGRLVEIAFSFVVSSDLRFPAAFAATANYVQALATVLNQASASDLARVLGSMGSIPQASTRHMPQFAAMATGVVDDPSRMLSAVTGLQGDYGRFATGRRSTMLPASATTRSALAGAVTSREGVLTAAGRLLEAGAGL